MPASPARRAAFRVVRRVLEQDAFADQALHAEAQDLDPRDRAFARRLAFGTVQRRRTLDHVVGRLITRRKLDGATRAALQLGAYQLLFLDGVPARAAVAEAVELVKGERSTGLVNAVLRRVATEGPAFLEAIEDEGVRESYPHWLVELWRGAYGTRTATKLMRRLNEPVETALRANRLKTSPEALAEQLGGRPHHPDAVVLDGSFDAYAHPLWAEGLFMPQSRSSQAVARAVDPQPGERVLDLCAAPGGKTTHLAALMRNEGELICVERNPDRADGLRRTCERMGVTIARIEVADAAGPRPPGDTFDRVLADPPCSGLGTLQSRPDLRWRMTPERIEAVRAEQRGILAAAAAAVRPGGLLIWSTCTLNPAENAGLAGDLDGFEVEEAVTLLPHETRSAGFEVTRMRSLA